MQVENAGHMDANMNLRVHPDREQITYCDNLVIYHSPHGFIVDFYQKDPIQPHPQEGEIVQLTGLVVARLHIPQSAMGEMAEVINATWQNYVAQAMPPEITEGGVSASGV